MQYRTLGRTGLRVSALALGSENFGPRTTPADAHALIDHALAQGVNLIDSANFYGTEQPDDYSERRGRSEAIVGEWLKQSGKRQQVLLSTKVRGPIWPGPNGEGASRWHILRACDESLRRLQTDYIDLYQIHWPDPAVPIDETLRALDELVRAGKVRYIGTSNFAAWQIMEGLWFAQQLGLNRFVSEQGLYNLVHRLPEEELFPMIQKHGIGFLVWSPLFAGFLTGRFRQGQPLPTGARLADAASERSWPRRRLNARAYALIDALDPIVAQKGCSIAQFAVAWLLAQPAVTSVIMGPRTIQHLEAYLGALEVEIADDDRARVDALVRRGENMLGI